MLKGTIEYWSERISRVLAAISQMEVAARDERVSHARGGVQVKIAFYTNIAVIVFPSLNVTLQLLDMQRWEPLN